MSTKRKNPKKDRSSGKSTSRSSSSTKRIKETTGTTVGDVVKSETLAAPAVERVVASEIAPTTKVDPTKLDRTDYESWQGRQTNLANDLEGIASGKTPSLADLQFQKASEQNIAQQFAMARSQRGSSNPALGMRNAQMQAAQIGQGAALDSAMARIQEQRSAQAMLTQVYGTAGAQSVQMAIAQGDITAKEALANAIADNERNIKQALLNQEAGTVNAGAQNTSNNLVYGTNSKAEQDYAAAMNARALAQANINSQLEQQRISSGATTRAASIGAGAANYATDAGLYKFNMENQLQLDQQAYGNRMAEAGAENTRNQGRGQALRDGIGAAGQAATAIGSSGAGGGGQSTPGRRTF